MSRIAVITDTDSSLPPAVANQLDIRQVPINVHFGDETYRTGFDINDAETFLRIDRDGKLPKTSAPSPGVFAEAYQAAFNDGYTAILCLTVSEKISDTYRSAITAAGMFPNKVIKVLDTKTLSMSQGFMAMAAAEAIARGAEIDTAMRVAEQVGNRSHVYVALPTLKYMAMSGRIGYLTAGLATLLDVKPLLTVRGGKLELLERVRTQPRAWGRVVELAVSVSAGKLIEHMAVLHVNAPEAAAQIEQKLRQYLPMPDKIIHAELTPGLSIHAGSGLVGVSIITSSE